MLKVEMLKLKHKHIGLMLIGSIFIQFVVAIYADNKSETNIIQGYMISLYQFAQLNVIIFPIIIGVIMSNLCDIEHKGNTFKQLFTMQEVKKLFNTKFIIATSYLLLGLAFQILGIVVIGQYLNFGDTLPVKQYILYFISQSATNVFVIILIQSFALYFSNQFVPIVLGITGSFLGLMSGFFGKLVMMFIPTSYYQLLTTVSMKWSRKPRTISYTFIDFPVFSFIIIISLSIITFFVGRRYFKKKEV
ncbi:hypothetical protein AN639_00400 [Candidatus Epulonipiscium fishelsonii]|uniref:Uncharacterized protein n=1 Tax=Candidatus Epulonipiscium fishelsonii TaxID=77094 RepID=A0ACC8XCT3_9FIRM|nr:hypothetical protein AN396_05380 [Epulopiscium sp. SCG-B11WGA-EpuloA1]ONI41846.1 hypothetical protein AN639_00400 [Epulopiscium sp. SCG-B05WGA-EpuloA1]